MFSLFLTSAQAMSLITVSSVGFAVNFDMPIPLFSLSTVSVSRTILFLKASSLVFNDANLSILAFSMSNKSFFSLSSRAEIIRFMQIDTSSVACLDLTSSVPTASLN